MDRGELYFERDPFSVRVNDTHYRGHSSPGDRLLSDQRRTLPGTFVARGPFTVRSTTHINLEVCLCILGNPVGRQVNPWLRNENEIAQNTNPYPSPSDSSYRDAGDAVIVYYIIFAFIKRTGSAWWLTGLTVFARDKYWYWNNIDLPPYI